MAVSSRFGFHVARLTIHLQNTVQIPLYFSELCFIYSPIIHYVEIPCLTISTDVFCATISMTPRLDRPNWPSWPDSRRQPVRAGLRNCTNPGSYAAITR